MELGLYIKNIREDNRYIYIWGPKRDQILSYSGRLATTPYFNALFFTYPQALEPARQSILDKKPPLLLLGSDKVENKKIPAWLQTIADTNYVKSETKGSYYLYRIKKPPSDNKQ